LLLWRLLAYFHPSGVYNNYVPLRIQSRCTLAVYGPLRTMPKRRFLRIAMLSLALGASAAGQSVAPDSTPAVASAKPSLFDRVVANQRKNEEAGDVYERIERLEVRKNPSDGAPTTVKIARVIPSGTGMTHLAVGPDGQPTDPAAYRADLERLEKALALAAGESRSQRDALEKFAKKRKERNDLIDSTRNAFLFTFVAREPRGDRLLSKYTMEPNPAFKPTTRFSAVLTKVHGFIWIDEDSGELARIEDEVTEDISVGLFLAKVYKGSHFMQERYEFFPGLWLASFSQYDFDGRKFFSGFSIHERTFYSNYRYIGPPKEALVAIRKELGIAGLGKPAPGNADP
jgi:hypothetical protein